MAALTTDEENCARAEALIHQAYECSDQPLSDTLMRQAHQMLAPLVAAGVPEALYLHACSTLSFEGLDEEAHGQRYIELIRQSAHAGNKRAQFRLGQMYEPDSELDADPAASALWFEKSAMQGHPYAQWVHGLNLLNGNGGRRDEALALDFIRRAAEGRFEGAIQFVADAYASGIYGLQKDEAAAEIWRRRLDEPGVMRY
jgi:TPR repeat protein